MALMAALMLSIFSLAEITAKRTGPMGPFLAFLEGPLRGALDNHRRQGEDKTMAVLCEPGSWIVFVRVCEGPGKFTGVVAPLEF